MNKLFNIQGLSPCKTGREELIKSGTHDLFNHIFLSNQLIKLWRAKK